MIVTRRGVTWNVFEPPATGSYVEGPHPGFWDEWGADRWERDTLEVMDRFVTPGSTFVDLGASIGPLSMWAVAHGAKAVAVEPDPFAFGCLTGNCLLNAPQVRRVNAAIADYNGYIILTSHPQGWGQAMSSARRYADPTSFELVNGGTMMYMHRQELCVRCFTVEKLFMDHDITNCSLVKMDIEGIEAEVCETVGPFLAGQGIPLLVEVHGPWLSRPMDPEWFSAFSEVEGSLEGFHRVVCVP